MVKKLKDGRHHFGTQRKKNLGVNIIRETANFELHVVASCLHADFAMIMWAITQWIGKFLTMSYILLYLIPLFICLIIAERQHRKWCACAVWLYKLLGLYAWPLHVMDFRWQNTIATYVNFLMMKGTLTPELKISVPKLLPPLCFKWILLL